MSRSLKGYQCNELTTCKESLPKALGYLQQNPASSGSHMVCGKSAVQRLEESKANYVKTESVLDCKQKLWHSSHLKVATRPSTGAFLKNPAKDLRKEPLAAITKEPCNVYRKENLDEMCSPREMLECSSVSLAASQTNSNLPRDVVPPAQHKPQSSIRNIVPHGAKGLEQSYKKRKFKKENFTVKNAIQCFETGMQSSKFDDEDWNAVTVEWQEEASGENFLPKHSESEGHSSGADSKHSSSLGDITELENQCPRSKTSDYVSRSSSFKCAYSSDRVRSLISSFEAKMNENMDLKKTNDAPLPVGRSKSDISHRLFKGTETPRNPLNSNNNEELQSFFNKMGLDARVWDHLTSRSESPAQFFESVSSLNSGDHRTSSDSDESDGLKEGLTNAHLRRHAPTETSIIEKNARVVKWLYSCRNSAK